MELPEDDDVFESPNKKPSKYKVSSYRWLILGTFVLYSASSSLQWTQYSIIQDTVVQYYRVSSSVVYWTTMVYMVTYIPLIFPASWLMDKTENGNQSSAGGRAKHTPATPNSKKPRAKTDNKQLRLNHYLLKYIIY